jgi:hypothetical protein
MEHSGKFQQHECRKFQEFRFIGVVNTCKFDAIFNFGRQSKIEQFKLKIVCFKLKSCQPLIYNQMIDIDYCVCYSMLL